MENRMKALVYQAPGRVALEQRANPEIKSPGDAIVQISKTTICGTDVHIVKGDVQTCSLHLERLWSQNITITTRLVDTATTPMLLKTVQARKIDPKKLITHRFKLDKILDAYDTLRHAAKTQALKVIIEA
jgi:threonine dehydrogenase-like Zn-dependent dehydrogenase